MWKSRFFRPLESSIRPQPQFCTRKRYQSTAAAPHFIQQGTSTEMKILKNNHYVVPSELLANMRPDQSWEEFVDKLPVFTAVREVDTMFAYVIHKLTSAEATDSGPTIPQWVALIDASAFADIELESVGYVVPVSERQPCSTTGSLTLQLLDHFLGGRKLGGADGLPWDVLRASLSVFHRLKIVGPVEAVFDKCLAASTHDASDSPEHSILWRYLRTFIDSIVEMDSYDCEYCLQAIDAVVSCMEKLCAGGLLAESDRSDASHIIACIARICMDLTIHPYRAPQEQFDSHLHDAVRVKEFLAEKHISNRILDGPFRLLEIIETDTHNAERTTEANKGDRQASMVQICASERHKQTLELFHKYAIDRSINHFQGLIVYHLTGQLQPNLTENNMKGFRTAAVETLRQMTLECGEKKLGNLIKAHNEKFQLLHKVVICAMCQPYFHQCLASEDHSGRTVIDWTNLSPILPAEDAFAAYQIFLIHRNYGYVPERIAMNALIKPLSERGEAAVFSIVDITVQNYKGAPVDSPKHSGVRNTKPVDYLTIEYLMKTCLVANDTDRARQLYWIMCEQFPGLQHRMTQKTKEYLTAMDVSNFSPSHIFSLEEKEGLRVRDLPNSPT